MQPACVRSTSTPSVNSVSDAYRIDRTRTSPRIVTRRRSQAGPNVLKGPPIAVAPFGASTIESLATIVQPSAGRRIGPTMAFAIVTGQPAAPATARIEAAAG